MRIIIYVGHRMSTTRELRCGQKKRRYGPALWLADGLFRQTDVDVLHVIVIFNGFKEVFNFGAGLG